MVKDLLQRVDAKRLLPAAFRKCGLAPLNRDEVLQRIPSILSSQQIAKHVDQQLVEKLEVRRFGAPKRKGRGPKIPAGQSYSAQEEEEEEDSPEEEDSSEEEDSPVEEEGGPDEGGRDEGDPQAGGSGVGRNKGRAGGVQYEEEDDNDEEEDSDEELPDPELRPPTTKIPGTMVVAVYEGEWFIAEVMEDQERGVPGGYTRLKFMAIKGNNVFAWPNKEDRVITYNEDILLENIDPIPLNSRGHFGLNEKDLKRVQSWMVVVYCPFIPWSFLFYFILKFSIILQ
jgi:hypothetical protein